MPDDEVAVERILKLKRRNVSQGLILIGASRDQFCTWIDTDKDLPSSAERPITWLAPATPKVPKWIRGQHDTVAVRVVDHPVAAALCEKIGSPLVSTSANVSGEAASRVLADVRERFVDKVDYVVDGACGTAPGSSEIRDLESGKVIRRAKP